MICPHCSTGVNLNWSETKAIIQSADNSEALKYATCPECNKIIIHKIIGAVSTNFQTDDIIDPISREERIYPLYQKRNCPLEVPDKYSNDFIESSMILDLSPKASAALSRRILEHIIRDEYKITKRNLADKISELIQNKNLPTNLCEAIDAIRNVGNFAAHPLKDTNTGEIIDVEPGEAEWLLDVLESLFDFTFVLPRKLLANKQKINEKLKNAGKPPMK